MIGPRPFRLLLLRVWSALHQTLRVVWGADRSTKLSLPLNGGECSWNLGVLMRHLC